VHLLLAHASLAAALGWTAWRPHGLLASALHPEVLACVHLVTLGCVATACLGVFPAVLRLAMGTPATTGWRDWAVLVAVQATASGVASHMALGTYSGVTWSAILLLVALALQLPRFAAATLRANAPAALRLGVLLAWGNLLLAVLLGGALALHRSHAILPGDYLQTLVAHAHLALAGFAATLVAALGVRLLPMVLPAHPAPAWLSLVAVLGLGLGGVGCAASVLAPSVQPFAHCLLVTGSLAWLVGVVTMLLRRAPPPAGLSRFLPSHLLVATAALSFVLATVLGVLLRLGTLGPDWWAAYGATLLLGGFGSVVLGIGQRLVPLVARLAGAPVDAHRPGSTPIAWGAASAWSAAALALPWTQRTGSELLLRLTTATAALAVLAVALASHPRATRLR
jgi:hypothetical protein